MNDVEFYSKALHDPVFRTQKIAEQRFGRNVAAGFGVSMAGAFVAYAGYCYFAEGRWPYGSGMLSSLVLVIAVYAHFRTRIHALEAMEQDRPSRKGI